MPIGNLTTTKELNNIMDVKETLEAGTYEIIRKRLQTQKEDLTGRLRELNDARKDVFTTIDFTLIANQRITDRKSTRLNSSH